MTERSREKIRYGIVGFGNFAERAIAPAIRASTNSELVAIQKRSLDAARRKAAEYDIPLAFSSVEELVAHNQVDAVFVVSANSQHCPETVAAARAKKHVLVEKPMAMNVAEVKRMIEACKRNRVKLMVGHMVRLSPAVVRIKELITTGAIGTVSFAQTEFIYDGRISQRQWLFDQKTAGGGSLFDVGVHCLDTLRFILDDEVTSVRCQFDPVPTKGKTESTANVSLKFRKGTLATIYCSYASSIRRSSIKIIGTEGELSAIDFTRSGVTVPLSMTLGGKDSPGDTRTENIVVPDLYIEEVNLFSACILSGTAPPVPGSEGLKNQHILERAAKDGMKR